MKSYAVGIGILEANEDIFLKSFRPHNKQQTVYFLIPLVCLFCCFHIFSDSIFVNKLVWEEINVIWLQIMKKFPYVTPSPADKPTYRRAM